MLARDLHSRKKIARVSHFLLRQAAPIMAVVSQATDPASQPHDEGELHFRGTQSQSLGVELELQIVERETGNLAPGALRILEACREEGLDCVSGEFMLTMLEVRTGVCQNVAEVSRDLLRSLSRVRNIARSLGYELALGGTHPYGRAGMSAVFTNKRYRRIQRMQGWTAYQEAIYGLHVHVGVPDGDTAIGVANLVTQYLPHLLALSANSPFWQGLDTGYASSRHTMFRPSALAGLPLYFPDWNGFCEYFHVMHDAGAMEHTKDIYWDVRPRPHLGTVEFRIFDAPPTMSSLLALAALTRALVADVVECIRTNPRAVEGDRRTFWLATQNKWLAGRFGLKAKCRRTPDGEHLTLADDAEQLLRRLRPVFEANGDDTFWPDVEAESGADRQRRIYRQTGNWQAVVDDMTHRWEEELGGIPECGSAS
jgi:carboxylate-amine ligase